MCVREVFSGSLMRLVRMIIVWRFTSFNSLVHVYIRLAQSACYEEPTITEDLTRRYDFRVLKTK
jgi:hypothetical protein